MSIDKKQVGKRLGEFAERYGSRVEFARVLGLKNSQQLYVYLNGQSFPGFELLAKLRELGCDPNWLIAGESSAVLLPVAIEGKNDLGSKEMDAVEEEVEKMVRLIKASRDTSQPMTSSSARELREVLRKWAAQQYRKENKKARTGKKRGKAHPR